MHKLLTYFLNDEIEWIDGNLQLVKTVHMFVRQDSPGIQPFWWVSATLS